MIGEKRSLMDPVGVKRRKVWVGHVFSYPDELPSAIPEGMGSRKNITRGIRRNSFVGRFGKAEGSEMCVGQDV